MPAYDGSKPSPEGPPYSHLLLSEAGAMPDGRRAGRQLSMPTIHLWRTVVGAAIGLGCAVALSPVAGLAWGAITRTAPCGNAVEDPVIDRIISGGLFGMFAFPVLYGLPIAVAGLLIGSVVVNSWPRGRTAMTRRVVNFLYPSGADDMKRDRESFS